MQLPSPYLTSAKQETPHVDAKVPDTGGEGAPLAATSSLMLGTGFLHELTDHLPVSVMVLEITELRVAYLNQRVEQEFDVRPRALLGRRITRALKGMVPVDVESVLWRAVRERRAVEHEFTLAQRKRHRIVNARFLATYDGCGYPTALIVIARDVSAERRAQRELAESRLRFQEFAAAVDDGVFVASLRRDSYHYVSPRMFELFDRTDNTAHEESTLR
ncbi:MAG TPA: PAS domain-containing protein [Burkholderiaceae bacterium]|nr:PAS domain-containing protein [Burkholderiaceae bacterium]